MGSSATRETRSQHMVLSHLDAAYNLARWLAGNDDDSRRITEEACQRALELPRGIHAHARLWLLSLVRNIYYDRFKTTRSHKQNVIQQPGKPTVDTALERLAPEHREIIVLREVEDLSYKEMSRVIQAPTGTVMLRLAQARQLLREALEPDEATPGGAVLPACKKAGSALGEAGQHTTRSAQSLLLSSGKVDSPQSSDIRDSWHL